MGGMQEFSTEEFLSYETRSKGSFLGSDWKKAGFINVWLHRKRPFGACWQHGLPRVDVRDDRETGRTKRAIFPGSYLCLESKDVLTNQYRRDRDTGERQHPPIVCPICLLIEHVHQDVLQGRRHWLEPIFEFAVGDPKMDTLIRASGMWNGYKPDRLSDEQKQEMDAAGISPKFGWKENMQAGLKYVFCLVDDAAVGKGVQIMKEGQALGDKVKLAIAKEMKRNSRDPSKGDPVKNPYAFCFEYKEQETPDKKYDAFRVDDLSLTPEIEKLITGTDAPDISRFDGIYSPETLRSQLEQCCLVEGLPWDEFFNPAAMELLKRKEEEAPAQEPRTTSVASVRGRPAATGRPTASPARAAAPAVQRPARPVVPPAEEEKFGCDGCGKEIGASEPKCRNCGHVYEVEAPVAPAPAPLRKRSEMKAPRAPSDSPTPSGQHGVSAPRRGLPIEAPRAPRPQPAQRTAPATTAPLDPAGEEVLDPGFGDFGSDEIPF